MGSMIPRRLMTELPFFSAPLSLATYAQLPLEVRTIPVMELPERACFQLNPWLFWQTEAMLPVDLQQRLPFVERFAPARPILWVRNPLFDTFEPCWPDREMTAVVSALMTGTLSVMDLSPEHFHLLGLARILLPAPPQVYTTLRQDLVATARQELHAQLWTRLPDLIGPVQIAGLRTYTRNLLAQGDLGRETTHAVNRNYAFEDQVFRFFHLQMTWVLYQVLGQIVKSSYTFLSYYRETGMGRHKDHDECVWNLSVGIDVQPDQLPLALPSLYIDNPEGVPVRAPAPLGSGVLYRGQEVYHGREALPPDIEGMTVALFHFVPWSEEIL
jgi:hypothetical protein